MISTCLPARRGGGGGSAPCRQNPTESSIVPFLWGECDLGLVPESTPAAGHGSPSRTESPLVSLPSCSSNNMVVINSVADPDPYLFLDLPDPDPHAFRPPRSGSITTRYGPNSGSFQYQAKIEKKPWLLRYRVLFCESFMSFYLWKMMWR